MNKIVNGFMGILDCNITQTIILLFNALIPIIMKFQNRQEAARIVILQIDDIDNNTKVLLENIEKDNMKKLDMIWQSAKVIEWNAWEYYRKKLICKLDFKEITAMDKYYNDALFILELQEKIKHIISEASKSVAYRGQDENKEDTIKIPLRFYDTLEIKYKSILENRVVIPYEKLRKIAKMK